MDGKQIGLVDAAHRLSQSWARTWDMVLRGELAGTKVGGRWLVDEADVDRVLRERRRPLAGSAA